MKVVHLSTMVNQSSANTRIHQALLNAGIDSSIMVLEKTNDIETCYEVKHSFIELIKNAIERRIEKYILHLCYPKREKVIFSSGLYGINILKDTRISEADIIHLHWINGGYISLFMLGKIIKLNKPIIWTIHDSWAFTGGCHVRYGCLGFTRQCGMCPMLGSVKENDFSRYVFERKSKLLKNNQIKFVCPSHWMNSNLKQSTLFKDNESIVISNPIDTDLFCIKDLNETEKMLKYQKDKSKFHLLFGAVAPTSTPYKGFSYLMKSLAHLKEQYPDLKEKIVLHIFGEEESQIEELKDFQCHFWGYISNPKDLAYLYSFMDVYVFPSLDDNLPNTVMESLSCGTPVVSFDTGGISDMVKHKKNGYLAKYKNTQDFCDGIAWILCNNTDNVLGINGRKKVESEFSCQGIAEKYIQFYQEQLERKGEF